MFEYLRSVREELTHVSWPSPQDAAIATALVIFVTLATALYLGAFDALLLWILERTIFLV